MTVVPDEHLMTLICDSCGDTTTGTACVLPDAEVVWTLVAEHGWSGSPFATGPHRCPRCSLPGLEGDATGQGGVPGGGVPGVDHLDDVAAATAAGNVDVDTTDELRAALRHAVDVGGHVVVDLTRVRLIDAGGLALLVRAHRDARERGAVLCLAAPSRFIRTVLHTMRLDGLFPVFASPQEAVRRLSPGGAGDTAGLVAAAAGPDPRGLRAAAVTDASSR
ncbi:STAS domain-containing protein [Micromonospora sp. DSM 115977]|uniref:STAS domain-containing protein n=1 Tax=Micromonospora reichwaldensis TaxID=3075516 RepID=A0ABU2X437_9ACTN|nr:STAS domain-containing protein [Micromonospora sp. DSM 115977]MDT0532964.1 STAS domain-containing protein [Micromonospora sp. DSM 115977]